jgi:hypothetical protein
MLSVPEPESTDPEDLTTALETAAIFSAQGDLREAVRWVRRAAELAGDAGDDMRALTLARAVADLGESMAPKPPAAAAPAAAAAPTAEQAAPTEELPPPPPLPGRAAAASGDRITNPGPAPVLSTPPTADASSDRVSTGPKSTPPATADDGWSDDAEADEATQVQQTNGAGQQPIAAAPEPVPAPAVAAPAPEPAPTPRAAASPVVAPTPDALEPSSEAEPEPVPVAELAPGAEPAAFALSALRTRVELTGEPGVFRVTVLGLSETAGPVGHDALLVLLDPTVRLG